MCTYIKWLFITVIVINFLISLKTNKSNIEMHIIHFQIEKKIPFLFIANIIVSFLILV